jgi:SEC-C motif-containing protein
MRARYSAYAAGESDYVWRTWHPHTRPDDPQSNPRVTWTRLDIVDVNAGQVGDQHGEVEFRAYFRSESGDGVIHERSQFAVRARQWFYLDGTNPH